MLENKELREPQDVGNNMFVKSAGVSKQYGAITALNNINLSIGAGEIVGLIGPNGAGKSTFLKALMGLIKYSGKLTVFGSDPYRNRTQMLERMSYIADVASLPGWMHVNDMLQFVEQTHPKFVLQRALDLLKESTIPLNAKIETLSKGMKTRLHLSTILAINTDFLVLDEPTLGLDVMVRRDFQDRLVKDYYNQQRSILVTTHQVDEIESILTRVLFIKEGAITMDIQMEDLKSRYCKLLTTQNVVFSDPAMTPIYQRELPGKTELIFADTDPAALTAYGEVQTPSLEDLFVTINS